MHWHRAIILHSRACNGCAPNVLLIPGTSSLDHLHENLRAAELELPDEVLARLDAIDSGGNQ
jgi:pyridoxine 4-dehydrogenase